MKSRSLISLLKKLWALIDKRRQLQFLILLILMISASIAEVFSIGLIYPFLSALNSPDKIFKLFYLQNIFIVLNIKKPNDIVFPLTILFCTTIILSGALRFLLLFFQTKLSHIIGGEISYNVYNKYLNQSYQSLIKKNTSDLITDIISKTNSIVHFTIIPLISLITSSIMLILVISLLFFLNFKLTILIIVIFCPTYFLVFHFNKNKIKNNTTFINNNSHKILKSLQEGFGGIRDVILDGTQEVYIKLYKNVDYPIRKATSNTSIIGLSPKFGFETLGILLIAILAYKMSSSSNGVLYAIPILGALVMGFQRLLPIFQQIYTGWTTLEGGKSALSDIVDILEMQTNKLQTSSKFLFSNKINLLDINFSYEGSENFVLKNINLEIKKGEKIGFCGSTGCGKSTLCDIIMGLLEPKNGQLLVDNVEINKSNSRNWQSNIAHVPQFIYLADSTIAENIALGKTINNIDFNKLQDVSIKAKIIETIEGLPNKFNTIVGERGANFSGGQRQRIGIARALYKNASVLVFDEATSSLDSKTELEVMDEIYNISKDLTILIISHNISTLERCDKIVELDKGVIKNIKHLK